MKQSSQIHLLHRRRLALQREANKLANAQRRAKFTLVLLDSLNASFKLMTSGAVSVEQQVADLQAAEGPIEGPIELEELELGRIGSRDDPLALLHTLLDNGAGSSEQLATAAELVGFMREAVLQGSVYLELKKLGIIQAAEFDDKVSQLWFRVMHPMLSAILNGRPEVFSEVTLFDLATAQPQQLAATGAADELVNSKTKAAVPHLGLSQLQVQDMAVGNALFARLANSLRQQYQQLQATSPNSSPVPSGDGGGVQHTEQDRQPQSSHRQGFLTGFGERLQQHTRAAERMQLLLQKEQTLKAAASAFVLGCLSWEQLAYGFVLTYPCPMRLLTLMAEVAQHCAN